MADFTLVDSNSLLPGRPITSSLLTALYENPLGMFEGATDAPRLYPGALERLEAGGLLRAQISVETFATDETWQNSGQFTCLQGGTLRFRAEARATADGTASCRISRVRAEVMTTSATFFTTGSTSYVLSGTVDMDCIPGDILGFQIQSVGLGTAYIRNRQIFTNGQDLFPGEGLGGYIRNNRALT